MFEAKILADSVAGGVRLTTFEITMPRFLDAEFNTHRMLSRNFASSRALPTEQLIEEVRAHPFVPQFNLRVKGMGVGEALPPIKQAQAANDWRIARDDALRAAERFLKLDKSRTNRLLEPFMWHRGIVSGTDWGNFFALRCAPEAQPEFRILADLMREAYLQHAPWECPEDCWHLPLCSLEEMGQPIDYSYWRQVSTARCARISYLTHLDRREADQDVFMHDRLLSSRHLSPFEHPAKPFTLREWATIHEQQEELHALYGDDPDLAHWVERTCRAMEYDGNYMGWHQYRTEIPDQHDYSLVPTLAA